MHPRRRTPTSRQCGPGPPRPRAGRGAARRRGTAGDALSCAGKHTHRKAREPPVQAGDSSFSGHPGSAASAAPAARDRGRRARAAAPAR